MSKPIILNEEDIIKVTITDTKAFIILEKDQKDTEYYNIRYMYSKHALNDDEHYCEICGDILRGDSFKCENHCTDKDRKRYRYDKMIEFVYACLEDNLIVDIITNDGKEEKYYKIQL